MNARTMARQHAEASLALYDALSRAGGGHRMAAAVRAFVEGSAEVTAEDQPFSMKYDGYLAAGERAAWGFTVNSRFDPRPVRDLVGEASSVVGAERITEAAEALAHALPRPGVTTLSFAFDAPSSPPRLKVYFQEDAWGAGVGTAAEVDAALAQLDIGCALPSWVAPDAVVGVVTLEAPPAARGLRAKAYVGAPDNPEGLFSAAPEEVGHLASVMRRASPLTPAYYYLTLRMERDAPVRYAFNKIYDFSQMRFGRDAEATLSAFRDIGGLFSAAGQRADFRRVVRELATPLADGRAPLVVPTASAVENQGRSVDFYCAAFALAPVHGRALP